MMRVKWAQTPQGGGKDRRPNFRQKKVLVDRIVGPTFRSASGCSGCRKRRRKCDETHPECKACVKRGSECVWREPKQRRGSEVSNKVGQEAKADITRKKHGNIALTRSSERHEEQNGEAEIPPLGFCAGSDREHLSMASAKAAGRAPGHHGKASALSAAQASPNTDLQAAHLGPIATFVGSAPGEEHMKTISKDTAPEEETALETPTELPMETPIELPEEIPIEVNKAAVGAEAMVWREEGATAQSAPLLRALPLVLPLFLSHRAADRMHHFGQSVCPTITVGTAGSNYFCKTFLSLAYVDEAIGHAIASWGAFYRRESEAQARHMRRAVALRARAGAQSRFDFFCALCFHLVACGYHVCRGDVDWWWRSFRAVVDLVQAAGGPAALCRQFGHTNDVKFVLSNLFYHDVLSSRAVAAGPAIPMQMYAEVFDADFFTASYGVDPLQGCMHPVYMLLGEVLEVRCAMARRRARLHQMLEDERDADAAVVRELERVRTDFLRACTAAAETLARKIAACEPDLRQFARAGLLPADVELHCAAFDVHRLALQLHCAMALRGWPPTSPEVELMQIRLRAAIGDLIYSRMNLVLCFPLLVAGVACHTAHDQRAMATAFRATSEQCAVGNVARAWLVVQETWRRSALGRPADWAAVCEDFGWHLCVC